MPGIKASSPLQGSWSTKEDTQAFCTTCGWTPGRARTMRAKARGHAKFNPGHVTVVRYTGDITYWTNREV